MGFRLILIALLITSLCRAEMPDAPQSQSALEQQAIESTSAQNLIKDKSGKVHLARWSLSMFAVRDKNGWGPSTRVDYRISNNWGLAATEVKQTVTFGFTVRLGSVK